MTILVADAEPNALLLRVSHLIDAGRTGAARPLLSALRGQIPSATLSRLGARLMLREGRLEEAGAELDAALLAAPENSALHKQRAQLHLQLDDLPGAAGDAADAVILDRHDPEAKALLGVVLTRLGQAEDAVICLGEALAAEPDNAPFRIAYAQAQARAGALEPATASLSEGVRRTPHHQELQEALILAFVRDGRFQQAVDAAQAARRLGALGPCGFGLLGHALSSMDRHAEAGEAYREAYKLAPEDPYVRHMVAASGALPDGSRAPHDYLRAVFDGYADRFEQHLIALGYRLPGLIRGLLLEPGVTSAGPTLDLGCGTGLLAVALADLPIHPITGIDISKRMLAHAAHKQLYDSLIEADLLVFLDADGPGWQLILAADVFCYMGPLERPLSLVASRLLPGGHCIFSVELLAPQPDGLPCRLGRNARYAHTHDHVCAAVAAAGLTIDRLCFEAIRQEIGIPVDGLLVKISRPLDA